MVALLFYIEPVCGGFAVLHRASLTKKNCSFYSRFVFTAFEICGVRLSYDDGLTVVFLGVYRPPPSRQNKLTNATFSEQFSDLLG